MWAPAPRTLFIDDTPGHVATAKSLGMAGHVHTSTSDTLARIQEFLLSGRIRPAPCEGSGIVRPLRLAAYSAVADFESTARGGRGAGALPVGVVRLRPATHPGCHSRGRGRGWGPAAGADPLS
ncbi:hypothetical protein GCM10023322_57590 [Rugosimonospora acidiphila]|uniref:Uncharacterized protein n=1 Tax=Rugosimonospora acidiphila TaxID=556531 RepID=A0ABP9SE72_9ACTN